MDSDTGKGAGSVVPGAYEPVTESVDIQNPVEMKKLWTNELSEINEEERQMNENMVHGIDSGVPETPEMVDKALNSMQIEINKIPEDEKGAYQRSMKLDSLCTQSRDFRLKFLRSVNFDPKDAALRYCRCLEYITDVFGEYALEREIYFSDLSEEEQAYMKEGKYQLLPCRDCLGRRIVVFSFDEPERQYSTETMFRVYSFILYSILTDDVSTQRNGVVYVGLAAEEPNSESSKPYENPLESLRRVHRMLASIPLYWGAVHLCLPDKPGNRVFTSLFMAFIGQGGRKKLRIHRGNRVECYYKLRAYGIPVEVLPQMHAGHLRVDHVLRLINVREAREAHMKEQMELIKRQRRRVGAHDTILPFAGIECPEINYIILGSHSQRNRNHLGNVAFTKIVFQNQGFQSYLHDHEDTGEGYGGSAGMVKFIDAILYESYLHELHFVEYNHQKGYYLEINQPEQLRKRIGDFIRQCRKRHRMKSLAKEAEDKTDRAKMSSDLSTTTTKSDNCYGCFDL